MGLNVLPRPGPAQPPPQIIGRPSDVERLLDEAGQRAQEVERGAAQAVEETAAVAAEEGEVAVAAEGVGGAFGWRGGSWRGAHECTGSSTSGSPASSRASSQSGFRAQAQSNNTPRPFSWGLNPVALPQSQSSRASSSSGQSRRSLSPPSFDQLARDIEAA